MLQLFFGIQGASAPVSRLTGELMLPFIAIGLLIVMIVNIKKNTGVVPTLFWMAFVLYISMVIELVFFPVPFNPAEFEEGRRFSHPVMNLIPFVDILCSPISVVIRNLVGNLLLLVPLGFSLPIILKGQRVKQKPIIILTVSAIAVELIQFIGSFLIFKMNWKIVDIDDVIMNILGGLVGLASYYILSIISAEYLDKVKGGT